MSIRIVSRQLRQQASNMLKSRASPPASGFTQLRSLFLPTKAFSLLPEQNLLFMQKRFKKKSGNKPSSSSCDKAAEEGENETDDDFEEEENDDDSKVMHTTVTSLRLDAIGKICFNMPRAKFDECFYNGLIRINGERVSKKSHEMHEDDEIDFIRGYNIEERHQLDVIRVNILKVDDKAASSGRIRISFRKTNKLTIANYECDPYEGGI